MSRVRIVHNKLLGGWYIVTGRHQTPLGGRFDSRAQAQAHLDAKRNPRYFIAAGYNLARAVPMYWTAQRTWSWDKVARAELSYGDALREAAYLKGNDSIFKFHIYPVEAA